MQVGSRGLSRAEATRIYPVVSSAIIAFLALASIQTRNERALFFDPGVGARPKAFLAVTAPVTARLLPRFDVTPASFFVQRPRPEAPARNESPLVQAVRAPIDPLEDVALVAPLRPADVFEGLDPTLLLAPVPALVRAVQPAAVVEPEVPEAPEPATWLTMIVGIYCAAWGLRRRRGPIRTSASVSRPGSASPAC